jgi:hypothetical protein
MSRNAPDGGQQLAHRRDHRDLAGFARGPKWRSHGLHRTALRTTIQSAFRSRALPNGIVGLPEKKRFFPDCRSRGATPT